MSLSIGHVAVGLAILVASGMPRPAAAASPDGGDTACAAATATPRVRSSRPAVAEQIHATAGQSGTFCRLLETIGRTDGLVYVSPGRCGRNIRACLTHQVIVAGPQRVLHILVDDTRERRMLMAAIGHELRHAVEVLENPAIASTAALVDFYQHHGLRIGKTLETEAAIQAGVDVYRELGDGR